MRFIAAVLWSLLCCWPGPVLAEEPPAALAMSISGSTTPALTPMSEIPAGAPIRLAPDTELTVLDYTRCKMVTVVGGTLTVTRFDFDADGGKITAEVPAPCPRIHQLSAGSGGAVAGGFIARGIENTAGWPLNRELVLAGTGAEAVKTAAIYAAGRLDAPLVRLEVSDRRARFPAGVAPLAVGGHYILRLTLADRPAPVDMPFIGKAPSGPSLVVVLRRP